MVLALHPTVTARTTTGTMSHATTLKSVRRERLGTSISADALDLRPWMSKLINLATMLKNATTVWNGALSNVLASMLTCHQTLCASAWEPVVKDTCLISSRAHAKKFLATLTNFHLQMLHPTLFAQICPLVVKDNSQTLNSASVLHLHKSMSLIFHQTSFATTLCAMRENDQILTDVSVSMMSLPRHLNLMIHKMTCALTCPHAVKMLFQTSRVACVCQNQPKRTYLITLVTQ